VKQKAKLKAKKVASISDAVSSTRLENSELVVPQKKRKIDEPAALSTSSRSEALVNNE